MAGLVSLRVVVFAAVVIGATAIADAGISIAATQQSKEDAPTVSADDLKDEMLPMPSRSMRPFPRDIRWMVTIRITPATDPEFWARLQVKYGGDIVMDAVSVEGAPLKKQLGDLLRENPHLTLNEVSNAIARRQWHCVGKECARLAGLVDDVQKLKVSVVPEDVLILHATDYEILFESRDNRSTYILSVPHGATTVHPLARWVNRVRQLIELSHRADAVDDELWSGATLERSLTCHSPTGTEVTHRLTNPAHTRT